MGLSKVLAGKVCLVTGATRGVGRGIALQLGEAGATVYITGRTLESKQGQTIKGSLMDTAKEVTSRGGRCIPVQVDHANDAQVESLFERIAREQNGQLDMLVNNVYAAVTVLLENYGVPFWEQPIELWDMVNNVGLRNHYMCSVRAARLMVPRNQGLIINMSSLGGVNPMFSPSYGIGKEACDRMAVDCAKELKKHNVTFVSIWPGAVRTEHMNIAFSDNPPPTYKTGQSKTLKEMMKNLSESVEFAGKGIVHLTQDPNLLKKSGYVLLTYDLSKEYGFKDVDGMSPPNPRKISYLVKLAGYPRLADWIPDFITVPKLIIWFYGYRFY